MFVQASVILTSNDPVINIVIIFAGSKAVDFP